MHIVSRLTLVLALGGILAPVALIVVLGFSRASTPHFFDILVRYGGNTLLLVALSTVVAFLAGVVPAFFVSLYRFPGRGFFRLGLLLPLALPGYLLAYVYADFLEFAGPVQTLIRHWFGYQHSEDYPFFAVRSIGMAALLLGVGLSPYVFAFTLASLDRHARNAFETARVLGLGSWHSFFRVILPLSRPAWAAGLLLVAMETIADFGAVQHLAVETLTLGIFNTWLERGDLISAARLALFAGGAVLLIGFWESRQRGARGFHASLSPKPHHGLQTTRLIGRIMLLVCLIPFLIGFGIPVGILVVFALQNVAQFGDPDFFTALTASLRLACVATLIGVGVALIVALGVSRTQATRTMLQATFLGYMFPGAIFALGLMLLLIPLSNALQRIDLLSVGLLAGSTGLIYGYVARFFAIAHGVLRSGVETIPASIEHAGRIYGWTPLAVWCRVKLPMLRGHILCAMILMFVETLKELPLTLILRPPGVETLATHLYHYAGDESLAQAAPAALVIILMGILAVGVFGWLRRI